MFRSLNHSRRLSLKKDFFYGIFSIAGNTSEILIGWRTTHKTLEPNTHVQMEYPAIVDAPSCDTRWTKHSEERCIRSRVLVWEFAQLLPSELRAECRLLASPTLYIWSITLPMPMTLAIWRDGAHTHAIRLWVKSVYYLQLWYKGVFGCLY